MSSVTCGMARHWVFMIKPLHTVPSCGISCFCHLTSAMQLLSCASFSMDPKISKVLKSSLLTYLEIPHQCSFQRWRSCLPSEQKPWVTEVTWQEGNCLIDLPRKVSQLSILFWQWRQNLDDLCQISQLTVYKLFKMFVKWRWNNDKPQAAVRNSIVWEPLTS